MSQSARISVCLQAVAEQIDSTLAKIAGERISFVLVVQADEVAQYVSNAAREDGAALIASLLHRWQKGRADIPAHYNPDLQTLASGPTAAARDVLAERRRQVEAEGCTLEHDDDHDSGELAVAAACYALNASVAASKSRYWIGKRAEVCRHMWPWDVESWKPKDQRSDLVRAAALLLAEIERLDRAQTGDANG